MSTTADLDLQALLRKQLGHCQKLLQEVTQSVGNWKENGGRAFETVTDVLIQAIFARSARTYAAIVEPLGNRGFAEQGAMLNRSLFEDMVDARWVSLNPDLALERLRQHDRYSHALRLDVAGRFRSPSDLDTRSCTSRIRSDRPGGVIRGTYLVLR